MTRRRAAWLFGTYAPVSVFSLVVLVNMWTGNWLGFVGHLGVWCALLVQAVNMRHHWHSGYRLGQLHAVGVVAVASDEDEAGRLLGAPAPEPWEYHA